MSSQSLTESIREIFSDRLDTINVSLKMWQLYQTLKLEIILHKVPART